MTVSADQSDDGQEVVIKVTGRFDFSCHLEFTRAFKAYPCSEKRYVVDFSGTDYMDSSALGMLLQLRDHSDKEAGVALINGSEGVREILHTANFGKLFTISDVSHEL